MGRGDKDNYSSCLCDLRRCTLKHVHVWANSKWHGTSNHHMTSCLLELLNFHSILELKQTPWNVRWNFAAIAVDPTVLDTLPDPEGKDLPNHPWNNATELCPFFGGCWFRHHLCTWRYVSRLLFFGVEDPRLQPDLRKNTCHFSQVSQEIPEIQGQSTQRK